MGERLRSRPDNLGQTETSVLAGHLQLLVESKIQLIKWILGTKMLEIRRHIMLFG